MNIKLIVICILFISCGIEIKGDYTNYMKFRNYALRTLLSKEHDGFKRIIEIQNIKIKYLKNITSKKIIKLYDSGLSAYYNLNVQYNSLSEDEKTILETILSLCY